jgi:hypothetical protein
MIGLYLITDAEGQALRKISCPSEEIEQQLGDGEQWVELDPLTDGFGIVEPIEQD